jgi:hypothetical protein
VTEPPVPVFREFAARLDAEPVPERSPNGGKTPRSELLKTTLRDLSPDESFQQTMLRRCRGLIALKSVNYRLCRGPKSASYRQLSLPGKHAPNYWNRKLDPENTPDHPEEARLFEVDYLMLLLGLPGDAVLFVPLCDADAWALVLLANVAEDGGPMTREDFARCVPGHTQVIDRLAAQRLIVLDVAQDTVELAQTALPLLSVKKTSDGARVYCPNRSTVRVYFSAPGVRVEEDYGRESLEPPVGQLVHPNLDLTSR